MDDAERELYAKAVAAALPAGDVSLLRDALSEDATTAVAVWFELQGATNTVTDALAVLVPLQREVGVGIDPAFGRVTIGDATDEVIAQARRALAHELVGASFVMLDLARTHALERVQFDRPIAQFQAVRHRLAESQVALDAAKAALHGAWNQPSPFTAMVAKATAGRSARAVARHAQQVLAGIGFTAEHPFHTHFRRVRVLDHLLGDAPTLTRDIGAQLLADGRLPTPLPL
ncbi:MAG TPA: acyl-CoA dehydrogenase family protein [Acidimicrobiales bacterium]|nr:acyl-CoA dehydrogenase family protein [Acidimicrobiales bacterium]